MATHRPIAQPGTRGHRALVGGLSLIALSLALGPGLTPAPARALTMETVADTGCSFGDNPPATEGTDFASSSCNASNGDASETGSVYVESSMGEVSGMATFSASATGYFTGANVGTAGGGTFTDQFTVTATDIFGVPVQGLGTMTADLGCSGAISSAASANIGTAHYLIGVTATVNVHGSTGSTSLVQQRTVSNGAVVFDDVVGDPNNCDFSVIVPVTFGQSGDITMTLDIAASGGAFPVTAAGVGSASGTADWSATFWWLGISEVLDPNGDPVGDFTALGNGGVDWAYPVPEPSRWLLLAAGLGCLVALCRVRRRP